MDSSAKRAWEESPPGTLLTEAIKMKRPRGAPLSSISAHSSNRFQLLDNIEQDISDKKVEEVNVNKIPPFVFPNLDRDTINAMSTSRSSALNICKRRKSSS